MQGRDYLEAVNVFLKKLPLWVYVIPWFCHIGATRYLMTRTNKFRREVPPHDQIASVLPDLSRFQWLVNVLVLVLCLPMLWMLVTHWPHGFFTSLFKYASLLTFIRCLTTTATVLPPNYQCADPDLTAVSPYLVGHCVDKMFSNHTALSLTVVLLYWRYGVLKGAWLCAAFALQVLSSFTHIPTRSHYTIDVLVAYLVALAIFFMFDL
tara:strand:+ start:672 stop:1295 length:624 start_codon:yes stop_codon:yes gene_type:complete